MKGRHGWLVLALALSGCAAPALGQGTTSITVNMSGAHFCGGATTTLSITTTPTSEGQEADATATVDAKVDATIPVR